VNYREVLAALDRGRVEPIYVLVGDEEFLKESILRRLIDLAVDPSTRDFNFDLFYGHEVEPGRVVEAASSYPMMAERRVVVVKAAEKLGPRGLQLIGKYALRPTPSTVLILLAEKLDLRGKGVKDLKSRAVWVECKRLYDRHVPGWIRGYVGTLGLDISDRASHLLHTLIGNRLRDLANELEKIAINLGDRKQIEEEDVRTVVGYQRRFGPFDLNDAVGSRDLPAALRILDHRLDAGDEPTALVARLTRHFTMLVKVKRLAEQHRAKNEIAGEIGLHPYFVDRYKEQASKFETEELGRAFEALLEADVALKSSARSPRLTLELLLFRLCEAIAEPSPYSEQPA